MGVVSGTKPRSTRNALLTPSQTSPAQITASTPSTILIGFGAETSTCKSEKT